MSTACGWLEGVDPVKCYDGTINYPGCGEVTVVAAVPHVVFTVGIEDDDSVTAEFETIATNAQTCYGAPVEISNFYLNIMNTTDEVNAACDVDNEPHVVACTTGSAFVFALNDRDQWAEIFGHELGHAFHEIEDHDGGDHDHHDNFWFGRADGEYGGLTKAGSVADCTRARGN